ncbi:MAG: class I SAM-dependent methyltransferase [Acidobacteriota bacterium]|nr:class I SAM-dependent methyltransferase [Acidobacteriota bacterium]
MANYRDDLAYIHHAGFSEFAQSAAPDIIAILARHGVRNGTIVDAGCGSGVLARELTSAGIEVFGFDPSSAMIALARTTAPHARFAIASLETIELPQCDAIVALGEVFNYGDARTFIDKAAHAIRKGGVLLFDVAEQGAYPPYDEVRSGGDDWSVIAIKESDGASLTRRVLTFRNVDGRVRRDEEVHTLALHDRSELRERLKRAGFSVQIRRSYGGQRLPRGHSVYLCVRK